MTRWYDLRPVDASVFETADQLYRYPVELSVPPQRVWESLVSDQGVGAWSRLIQSLQWTSPRPFGVGSTRLVVLPPGAAQVQEYFFRWEEGVRHSFYVKRASLPGLEYMAEDYLIEPTANGCRFTWTFALAGTGRTKRIVNASGKLTGLAFRRMAHSATPYFATQSA